MRRSPTTSSRCPCPTGTIESTARMPDASGSETPRLVTIPGAVVSINHRMPAEGGLECLKRDAPSGPIRDPTSQAPAKTAKRVSVLKASAPGHKALRPPAGMTKAPIESQKNSSRRTWTTITAVAPTSSTSPIPASCKPAIFTTLAPKYMTTPRLACTRLWKLAKEASGK